MSSFRDAINLRKAFKQLKYNVYRSTKYGTQANSRGQIIINRREEEPVKRLSHFLPYAHQSSTLRGLNAKLDELIEFAELPAVGSSLERLRGLVSKAAPKLQTSARFLPETEAVAMKQAKNRFATMNPYWKRTTAMYPGSKGLTDLSGRDNPLYKGSARGWLANKRPIGTLPRTSTQSLLS